MALQKNPGPLLSSWFKGLVDHIPPEWRARLGLKKRDQQDPVDIDPDAISGVLVNSEVAQTRTDERKKSDIELATDPTGVELNQQKRLANGQVVTEVRTFVPEGTPLAGTSVETIEAEQKNLGIGWMTNDVTDADLPGPTVESSQIDHDGVIVQVLKTRRLRSTIVEGETLVAGIWTKTTEEGETDLVATEVVQKRTIPGVPMDTTRLDEDMMQVTIRVTYKKTTTIVTGETVVGGIWTKTHIAECSSIMGASELVSDEVIESRALPGNLVPGTKLDKDGVLVNVTKRLKLFTTITSPETLSGGVWTKVSAEPVGDLVAEEIVQSRTIPGVPIVTSRIDDTDGAVLERIITFKPKTPDTSTETITSGFWIKIYQAPCTSIMGESVLVIDEVVEGKPLPGNSLESAVVDGDQEIQNIHVVLRDESLITPSSSEGPSGFITTVEKKAVSDLVANQITTVTRWLDKAVYAQSIPDSIIPLEFRAQIPTVVESHVVAGTASMPTLVGSQISTEERQLTKNLKEVRNSSFGEDITFPIDQIGYELTEEFGGGVLEVTRRLNNAILTVDEGEDVVRSHVQPIGEALMWFRETARRYLESAWPLLESRLWDPNFRIEYDETKQVVDAGTSEDPDPGGVFAWMSEVRAIDKWRSIKINTSKPTPAYVDEASALISFEFKPFKFPGLLTPTTYGYYVRSASAELIQHKIRTWWETSATTPVVVVEEIIPDNVVISTLNDSTSLAYSGMVLHDNLTTFGTLVWPATIPDYTTYLASWQGFEHVIAATVTPEKEKDIWKVQTESVIMR